MAYSDGHVTMFAQEATHIGARSEPGDSSRLMVSLCCRWHRQSRRPHRKMINMAMCTLPATRAVLTMEMMAAIMTVFFLPNRSAE